MLYYWQYELKNILLCRYNPLQVYFWNVGVVAHNRLSLVIGKHILMNMSSTLSINMTGLSGNMTDCEYEQQVEW